MTLESCAGFIVAAAGMGGMIGYVLGRADGYANAVDELRDAITNLVGGDRGTR